MLVGSWLDWQLSITTRLFACHPDFQVRERKGNFSCVSRLVKFSVPVEKNIYTPNQIINDKGGKNMAAKDLILKEIEHVPEPYLREILDFIQFLKAKDLEPERKIETAIMSESSLKKDWLRPEEDEAWQDL